MALINDFMTRIDLSELNDSVTAYSKSLSMPKARGLFSRVAYAVMYRKVRWFQISEPPSRRLRQFIFIVRHRIFSVPVSRLRIVNYTALFEVYNSTVPKCR